MEKKNKDIFGLAITSGHKRMARTDDGKTYVSKIGLDRDDSGQHELGESQEGVRPVSASKEMPENKVEAPEQKPKKKEEE